MSLPSFVTDIRIPHAFKGYSCKIEDCILLSNNPEEHIIDSKTAGFCLFAREEEILKCNSFTVLNYTKQQFALLQIDNKLIKKRIKRCDCAILNDKVFLLIELKTEALGHFDISIYDTYSKAIKQIEVTLNLFNSLLSRKGVELLTNRRVEAYICLSDSFPKATSTKINCAVSFVETNKVPLYFESKREI